MSSKNPNTKFKYSTLTESVGRWFIRNFRSNKATFIDVIVLSLIIVFFED